MAQPSLFLCHSSRDKEFARRLATDLDELGVHVWYDDWQLSVGDSLHDCIASALEETAYVGVLLSPSSLSSRWCKEELYQALSREKRTGEKVVLPLLYQNVSLPPFLEDRLYITFSRSYFEALIELTGFLYQLERKLLNQSLSGTRPTDLDDVRNALKAAGFMPDRLSPDVLASEGVRLRGSAVCTARNRRLKIPALFSNFWNTPVFLTSINGESCLIYPLKKWEELEEALIRIPSANPVRQRFLERVHYFGLQGTVGKRGEVTLPSILADSAMLTGKLVCSGVGDHLDVWNFHRVRRRVETERMDREDLDVLRDAGIVIEPSDLLE